MHGCPDDTSTEPVVSRGSVGGSVRELQCLLKYWGLNPGAIDGVFGSTTEMQVRRFQAW
ncbi:peptidoglycan-binding domain-containing protein [Streptomyces sp. NPDC001020]